MKKQSLNKNHFIIKAPAKGGSMMPLIKEKSQLLINLNPKEKYRNGDIVIFLDNGRLAVHRIIKSKNCNFILKGDNNYQIDGSFKADQLFGKVKKIIYPKYSINLDSQKNQFLKYFFVFYSRLNLKFPSLLKLKELHHIPALKFFYRLLVK